MKVMDSIERVFTFLAMICLFATVVIVALDGLGRQFFNTPIVGAYVLVEKYLMVAMIFPVIGYTWAQKGHIGVTLFYDKMPLAVQNISHLITLLIGLALFGLIGLTGYDTTVRAITGHQITSGLIRWPLWLSYIWMPIGCFLFCLRLIIEFIVCIDSIRKRGVNNYLVSTGASTHSSCD